MRTSLGFTAAETITVDVVSGLPKADSNQAATALVQYTVYATDLADLRWDRRWRSPCSDGCASPGVLEELGWRRYVDGVSALETARAPRPGQSCGPTLPATSSP